MAGFVRALAVSERSVLGGRPDDPALGVIDEARRGGMRVILVSDRTVGELRHAGDALLEHFDGVVAESGVAVRVGGGPVRRLAEQPAAAGCDAPREALLEVLAALDVDPHDALGVSGDAADGDLLHTLEVSVAATTRSHHPERADGSPADYRVAASGADALRRVLDDARHGLPVSPPRHDVRLTVGDPGDVTEVRLPGGHANVLLCAAAEPLSGLPTPLVSRWSAAGYSSVVLDLDDRYAGGLRVDPARPGWPAALEQALLTSHAAVVVSLGHLPGTRRSQALVGALAAVRRSRLGTGRPHWLVLDAAEPVLADPDLPPEALDFGTRGYCLVLRDHAPVASVLLDAVDVVLPCSPGCPVPRRQAARTLPGVA